MLIAIFKKIKILVYMKGHQNSPPQTPRNLLRQDRTRSFVAAGIDGLNCPVLCVL